MDSLARLDVDPSVTVEFPNPESVEALLTLARRERQLLSEIRQRLLRREDRLDERVARHVDDADERHYRVAVTLQRETVLRRAEVDAEILALTLAIRAMGRER